MNQPLDLIDTYYPEENELKKTLLIHSRQVADKALWIAHRHPEFELDETFLYEAAMLHDIGIFLTNAAPIHCFGKEPYIRHGLLGSQLVREAGFLRHALVCERHTGTGISRADIAAQKLPLPDRDFMPQSQEEKVICFADKFYSKTKLNIEKPVADIERSLAKYGENGIKRFQAWCKVFL